MNVYDVHTPYTHGQNHCVVAKNYSQAEELFKTDYPYVKIEKIILHAEYVIVGEAD